jgi:hypothetical protein
MNIPKQQAHWARVNDNVVTHLVNCTLDWVKLNAWPDHPGVWILSDSRVRSGWHYDPANGVFTPPVTEPITTE